MNKKISRDRSERPPSISHNICRRLIVPDIDRQLELQTILTTLILGIPTARVRKAGDIMISILARGQIREFTNKHPQQSLKNTLEEIRASMGSRDDTPEGLVQYFRCSRDKGDPKARLFVVGSSPTLQTDRFLGTSMLREINGTPGEVYNSPQFSTPLAHFPDGAPSNADILVRHARQYGYTLTFGPMEVVNLQREPKRWLFIADIGSG